MGYNIAWSTVQTESSFTDEWPEKKLKATENKPAITCLSLQKTACMEEEIQKSFSTNSRSPAVLCIQIYYLSWIFTKRECFHSLLRKHRKALNYISNSLSLNSLSLNFSNRIQNSIYFKTKNSKAEVLSLEYRVYKYKGDCGWAVKVPFTNDLEAGDISFCLKTQIIQMVST